MKRIMLVVLSLLLALNIASAEKQSFLETVSDAGFSADKIVADGQMFTQESIDSMTAHGNFISFSDSSYLQMIIWCEDETPYGFSVVNFDGSADMSQARTLFIQAIKSFDWEGCSYSKQNDDGTSISLNYAPGFEAESEEEYFETLDEFIEAVNTAVKE